MDLYACIICGVSGLDGSYLAKYLVEKSYEVIGTSRNTTPESFKYLQRVGVSNIEMLSMSIRDSESVYRILTLYKPDKIYNLSGLTSVQLSFEQPLEAMESTVN